MSKLFSITYKDLVFEKGNFYSRRNELWILRYREMKSMITKKKSQYPKSKSCSRPKSNHA